MYALASYTLTHEIYVRINILDPSLTMERVLYKHKQIDLTSVFPLSGGCMFGRLFSAAAKVTCTGVLVTVVLGLLMTSVALAGAKRDGFKYFKAGEYSKAIKEFRKLNRPGLHTRLALIESYLYLQQDDHAFSEAKDIFAYRKTMGDLLAEVFIRQLNRSRDPSQRYYRLLLLDRFPQSEKMKKLAGEAHRKNFDRFYGRYQKKIRSLAVSRLGYVPVLGFNVERLGPNKAKIMFHDERTVRVFEWKAGMTVAFTEVSNPKNVLRYYPGKNVYRDVKINFPLTSSGSSSTFFKGKNGDYLVIESKNTELTIP